MLNHGLADNKSSNLEYGKWFFPWRYLLTLNKLFCCFNHLKTDCSSVGQRFNVTENEVRISEVIWHNERKGDGFVKIDNSGRRPTVQTVRLPND